MYNNNNIYVINDVVLNTIHHTIALTGGRRKRKVKCYYKGTEPSPKGYGHCAHLQKRVGVKKIGTDRKMWAVKKRSNGSQYWTRVSKKTKERQKRKVKCYYKGTEPSPKGYGHCAHIQKRVGVKKIGTDRKMWVVKKRLNGSQYWARISKKK